MICLGLTRGCPDVERVVQPPAPGYLSAAMVKKAERSRAQLRSAACRTSVRDAAEGEPW